ncbi:MAG: PTS sugar transporter subunit IIC [Endomicrobium sp.]|nr:PTS sugar transporter subunit IIC [Endomicrobium sp.]
MTANIIFIALIGVLCSTDITAFGQFMICRPIFCAPIVGFFMGDINTGLWIGMIAEMLWVNAMPMGVSVPIDVAIIGILPTFWVCKYFTGVHEAAIFGLVLAVPFAYLHREMDIFGRNFNTKIMHLVEKGIRNGNNQYIGISIFTGLFFFIIRAFLFYILAMIIGGFIYKIVYLWLSELILLSFRKAWLLLPMVGFGVALYNFKSTKLPFYRGSSND